MATLLKPATNTAARAKVGLLGFGGSGKTTTAALIAIGLAKLPGAKGVVAMLDSENGSDFLIPLFEREGVGFLRAKSRTFADLVTFTREAAEAADVAIVDSITHYWRDLVSGYQRALKRKKLYMQDWGPIKDEWQGFSGWYVDAPVHAIICGRAGYEWDQVEDEEGRRELQKTGIKMKAETEVGFEPSLLIEMQRVPKAAGGVSADPETHGWTHRAIVLKDRASAAGEGMDGQLINDPTFESFLPHFRLLNLSGDHVGTAGHRDTASLFDTGESRSEYRQQCEIAREEIEREFVLADISSQSKEGRKRIYQLLERCLRIRTWKELERLGLDELRKGLEILRQTLRPQAAATAEDMQPPEAAAPAAAERAGPEPETPAATREASAEPMSEAQQARELHKRIEQLLADDRVPKHSRDTWAASYLSLKDETDVEALDGIASALERARRRVTGTETPQLI